MISLLKQVQEYKVNKIVCVKYVSMLIFQNKRMKCKMMIKKVRNRMIKSNRVKIRNKKQAFVIIYIKKLSKKLKLDLLLANLLLHLIKLI
jgi:hypothetical protein